MMNCLLDAAGSNEFHAAMLKCLAENNVKIGETDIQNAIWEDITNDKKVIKFLVENGGIISENAVRKAMFLSDTALVEFLINPDCG